MKKRYSAVLMGVLMLSGGVTQASPSAEEIRQLGTTLTPWGAEIAGNKEGTIPAYTGGMAPVADGQNHDFLKDPFAADKSILSIDAKNMAQYADRLTAGTQELMRRWPSFRIEVYPTHRSYSKQPKQFGDAAIKNAGNPECKTVGGGVGIRGCWGGTPFPIPKTGYEAMWNHQLRESRSVEIDNYQHWLVDSAGVPIRMLKGTLRTESPYWIQGQKPYEGRGEFYRYELAETSAPAREAGTKTLLWYPLLADTTSQRTWTYTTGQRRTRLAPEFAYDTPVSTLAGALNFDEIALFSGRMDRFDFKLVGKKEMYVPYNAFALNKTDANVVLGKQHHNPDTLRFELHRVWVVEAVLKQGMRHVASKRTFYLDEDSWVVLAEEGFDQAGKIFRVIYEALLLLPGNGTVTNCLLAYDLNKGQYVLINHLGDPQAKVSVKKDGFPPNTFLPEAMAGTGVR